MYILLLLLCSNKKRNEIKFRTMREQQILLKFLLFLLLALHNLSTKHFHVYLMCVCSKVADTRLQQQQQKKV
jgi:hypothetical protein